MHLPDDLLYSKEHEWLSLDDDIATIGITDHAQEELGDVVYVELPETRQTFSAGEAFGSVESVKAVSEIYSPVSGKVVEVNETLAESPETVNEDPYGEAWMVRIRIEDRGELDELLSPEDYKQYVEEEAS